MEKKSFSFTVKSALANNLCQTWHGWLEVRKLSNKEKNKTKKSATSSVPFFLGFEYQSGALVGNTTIDAEHAIVIN